MSDGRLGGFNRWLQHFNKGGCDGHGKVEIGSIWTPSTAVTRSAVVAARRERQLFCRLISAGLSSEAAAIKAGVSPPVGTKWFREAGQMPPSMFRPAAKPLSGRCLSTAEREDVALLLVRDHSFQEIGRRLGRSASTILREVRRNATTRSGGLEYRATVAQWHAERSARRPKATKLAGNAALCSYVEDKRIGRHLARSRRE